VRLVSREEGGRFERHTVMRTGFEPGSAPCRFTFRGRGLENRTPKYPCRQYSKLDVRHARNPQR
jgi:hypothetical protein